MRRDRRSPRVDYFQFYLWDEFERPEAPTDYTPEDIDRRIKAGPFLVVIQPARNMTVDVEIEIAGTATIGIGSPCGRPPSRRSRS